MAINVDLDERYQFDALNGLDEEDFYLVPQTRGGEVVRDALLNYLSSFVHSDAPDFYSAELNIALEVMRVDETVQQGEKKGKLHDPVRVKERKRVQFLRDRGFLDDVRVHFNVRNDVPLKDVYSHYVVEFQRVVDKHAQSVAAYREKHPGATVVFLIHDVSYRFVNAAQSSFDRFWGAVGTVSLNKKTGLVVPMDDYHFWWLDEALRCSVYTSGADYIAWHKPYMTETMAGIGTTAGHTRLPKMVIMDVAAGTYVRGERFYNPATMFAL